MAFDYIFAGTPYPKNAPGSSPALALDSTNHILLVSDGSGNWVTPGKAASGSAALTAAGTNQATALKLGAFLSGRQMYNVGTVASGTGVVLPASIAGQEVVIYNGGANALLIYPAGTEQIDALGASVGYSLASGGVPLILYCFAAGQWYHK